jgi:hypothetical protein
MVGHVGCHLQDWTGVAVVGSSPVLDRGGGAGLLSSEVKQERWRHNGEPTTWVGDSYSSERRVTAVAVQRWRVDEHGQARGSSSSEWHLPTMGGRQPSGNSWRARGSGRVGGRRLWWLATAAAGWALWRASKNVGAGGCRQPCVRTLIRLTYNVLIPAIVS